MISDLSYRQTFGKKPRGAGMAQRMSPAMGSFDSKRDKSAVRDIIDAPRLKRPTGRLHAEEDFRARRRRSYRVDVAGKRLSNGRNQRIELRLTALQTEKP
jgi:hypothetical protein